ncbi:MAG: DinB family protein [Niabella sp.]
MEIIPLLLKELEQEAVTIRKFLNLVPMDKLEYKPHPKSMSMMNLSTHIAELPGWISMALQTDGLDFAVTPYQPTVFSTTQELLDIFETALANGKTALGNAKEEDLLLHWVLRYGDNILSDWTKYEVVRHALAQIIHHRAQLGVYLRLLDIPIPGSYGPSADDGGTI